MIAARRRTLNRMEGPLPLNRLSAPLRRANAVLRARSRVHFVHEFAGPLSIKSVTEGTVSWKCAGRERVVDRDSFLVLNSTSRTPWRSIRAPRCRRFACFSRMASWSRCTGRSSRGNWMNRAGRCLSWAACTVARSGFCRACRPSTGAARATGSGSTSSSCCWRTICSVSTRICAGRAAAMPASRPSTRAELFRRVRRGQEYLHASACADPDLAEVARQACLSPFHFHRAFARAFGQTPHQYRNRLRLDRARRLLEVGGMTVTEVCGAVGFESAASFSALFRRAFGVPPSALRPVRISKIR